MTIGSASASHSSQEQQINPDFEVFPHLYNLMVDFNNYKGEFIEKDTRIGEYRIKHGHER